MPKHPNRAQRRKHFQRLQHVHQTNARAFRQACVGFGGSGSTPRIKGLSRAVGVAAMERWVKKSTAANQVVWPRRLREEANTAMELWHKRRKALERAIATNRLTQSRDDAFHLVDPDGATWHVSVGLYGAVEIAADYRNRRTYAHCVVVDIPAVMRRGFLDGPLGCLRRFVDNYLLCHPDDSSIRYIYPSSIVEFIRRLRAYMRSIGLEVPFTLRRFDEHGELVG